MFPKTFDQIDNSLLTEDKQIFKKMKIGVEFEIENKTISLWWKGN